MDVGKNRSEGKRFFISERNVFRQLSWLGDRGVLSEAGHGVLRVEWWTGPLEAWVQLPVAPKWNGFCKRCLCVYVMGWYNGTGRVR